MSKKITKVVIPAALNHSYRQNGLQPVIACTSGSGQAVLSLTKLVEIDSGGVYVQNN